MRLLLNQEADALSIIVAATPPAMPAVRDRRSSWPESFLAAAVQPNDAAQK
jgi:hypothetical protein